MRFYFLFFLLILLSLSSCLSGSKKIQRNLIFFHPDGMSLSHWDLARIITVGPDGLSSWDKMPHIAVYKPHLKENLVASSQAGATVHAYGEKVNYHSFGTKNKKAFKKASLLKEAQQKGFKTGLLQSGFLMEPGTAVFASHSLSRKNFSHITKQLIYSNVSILLGGGEKYLLPEGVKGHFGLGVRKDGKNLIEEAKKENYLVIYTLEELKNIPQSAKKVLGIFAYDNTYNDETEEVLLKKGLPAYHKTAPSIAQMSKYALKFLTRFGENFFLVVEEEGTDNFSNKNNAEALFEAMKRSLKAIELFRNFIKKNKNTLFLVASDSNASSPALIDRFSSKTLFKSTTLLPKKTKNGSPLDRKSNGLPFLSQPDKENLKLPFAIAWPTKMDTGTGLVIKSEGWKAHKIQGTLDNTKVYDIIRQSLFE